MKRRIDPFVVTPINAAPGRIDRFRASPGRIVPVTAGGFKVPPVTFEREFDRENFKLNNPDSRIAPWRMATGPQHIKVVAWDQASYDLGKRYLTQARLVMGMAESLAAPGVSMTNVNRQYPGGVSINVRSIGGGQLAATIQVRRGLEFGLPSYAREYDVGQYEPTNVIPELDFPHYETWPFLWVGLRVPGASGLNFDAQHYQSPGELGPRLTVWEPDAPVESEQIHGLDASGGGIVQHGAHAKNRNVIRSLENQEDLFWNGDPSPRRATNLGVGFYGHPSKERVGLVACAGLGDTIWADSGAYLRSYLRHGIDSLDGDVFDDETFAADGTTVIPLSDDSGFAYWQGAKTADPIDPKNEEPWWEVFVADEMEGKGGSHVVTITNELLGLYAGNSVENPCSRQTPRNVTKWNSGGALVGMVPRWWEKEHPDENYWTAGFRPAVIHEGEYRITTFFGYPGVWQPDIPWPTYGQLRVVCGVGPYQTVSDFEVSPIDGGVYGPMIYADPLGSVRVGPPDRTFLPLLQASNGGYWQ